VTIVGATSRRSVATAPASGGFRLFRGLRWPVGSEFSAATSMQFPRRPEPVLHRTST
jgi:hypothetical protein